MALPKIQQPLYELIVPSTKQKVKYRPFTVKEEKILLVAQESKDIEQIILAIKQIITNCVEGVDADELAMFDLEYLMINLRAKSVNNVMDFKIKDSETDETIELSINIDDIKIKEFEDHTRVIDLTDDIKIGMVYPKIDQLTTLVGKDDNEQEAMFAIIVGCIDTVISGEEVTKLSEISKEEVDEFIDSFTTEHINKLKHFFDTMPVMRFEQEYTRKDGVKRSFVAQGTETFFI